MSGWVLRCCICGKRVEGEGPMWHTTQPFMCDDCTVKGMEVGLAR